MTGQGRRGSTCAPRARGRLSGSIARPALVLALAVGSAALVGGCTAPRNALGTPTGRCFKVLPEARRAVHDQGRFAGVRYVTVTALAHALRQLHPQMVDVPLGATRSLTDVCVVAYLGRFESASVARGWPADAKTGRLALVVVEASNAHVLTTVVLSRAPIALTHLDSLDG
ncbi:MAG: hypothetical protein JWO62_873 [Acidimicrobiaceae bacterium]|nr:hypothetical protein [Acidimicrobiaceae bacterium]